MGEEVAVVVEVFVDQSALIEERSVDGQENEVVTAGVEGSGDLEKLAFGRAVDEPFLSQARRRVDVGGPGPVSRLGEMEDGLGRDAQSSTSMMVSTLSDASLAMSRIAWYSSDSYASTARS